MRQIENMEYVPSKNDRIKITYGGPDGKSIITGTVTKIHVNKKKVKNGNIWRYDILSDTDIEYFIESKSSLSVNLYREISGSKEKMNTVHGNVEVEKFDY